MREHTAGPVTAEIDTLCINGLPIAFTLGSNDEANAERLALCWNSYDDLVAACKWIRDALDPINDGGDAWCALWSRPGAKEWSTLLNTALAAAEPQLEKVT